MYITIKKVETGLFIYYKRPNKTEQLTPGTYLGERAKRLNEEQWEC